MTNETIEKVIGDRSIVDLGYQMRQVDQREDILEVIKRVISFFPVIASPEAQIRLIKAIAILRGVMEDGYENSKQRPVALFECHCQHSRTFNKGRITPWHSRLIKQEKKPVS